MAFIYDVDVTVHSVIENLDESGIPEGEPEVSLTTTEGFLKATVGERSDTLVISYSEMGEGGRTNTDITLDDGRVTLKRLGEVDYSIAFSEGGEYSGIYSVGPYRFDMIVRTRRITSTLTREGGEVRLIYTMNVGGAEKSCRMRINVKRK